MTPTETADFLRQFNDHRRGCDVPSPKPSQIGRAIDAAVEMIERLEAAERSDAESIAMYRKARDERDAMRARIEAMEEERTIDEQRIADLLDELNRVGHENDAMRARIEAMERQEPFDADNDVFRSAFEAALKAGNWPATRQGDGYRSPTTQIAWRIAFSTVNRLKLYLAPGAKGEEK